MLLIFFTRKHLFSFSFSFVIPIHNVNADSQSCNTPQTAGDMVQTMSPQKICSKIDLANLIAFPACGAKTMHYRCLNICNLYINRKET